MDVDAWVQKWVARLNKSGLQIEAICLTIEPPGPMLIWSDLDFKWKTGDKKLFALYHNILEIIAGYDVFINWNGINIHPEFLQLLSAFNVYSCFDDPESSEILSKPVARYYDLCLVGNIAELETYKSWGVKNIEFWPLGYFEGERDKTITEEQIQSNERDVDVALVCERESQWRKDRLDQFTTSFPQGSYYGRGWAQGFLDEADKLPLYKRTKNGPNFHNSTGPINFRTYMLPANGVMLLCDNKSYLAKLYKLGEEAVGFDTVEKTVELCKYYLKNDTERKRIAVNSWRRAIRDYNEVASFQPGLSSIKKYYNKKYSQTE